MLSRCDRDRSRRHHTWQLNPNMERGAGVKTILIETKTSVCQLSHSIAFVPLDLTQGFFGDLWTCVSVASTCQQKTTTEMRNSWDVWEQRRTHTKSCVFPPQDTDARPSVCTRAVFNPYRVLLSTSNHLNQHPHLIGEIKKLSSKGWKQTHVFRF